jgi:VWFA-related protein
VAAGAPKPPSAPGSHASPSVVALAYDRLSPEGRALAYKASVAFLQDRRPDEMAGVFILDQTLQTLSTYTTNGEQLKAAVEKASSTATSQMGKEDSLIRERNVVGPAGPAVASAESAGRPPGGTSSALATATPGQLSDSQAAGAAGTDAAVREMVDRMDRSYQDLLAQTQGYASIDGLLALIDSLGTLPGRKTVIYFCEGLTIPPSVEPRFRSAIDTANRRNVSIYALDSAGLRVHSEQENTASQLTEITKAAVTGVERSNNGKWTEDLERNETLLRSSPSAGLGILTSQTGGLLIQNTNALDKGIQRIDEDRRFHYLLGYTSSNPALDGTYRHIEVKVKRSGVEAHARPGYLAVPADMGAPVLSYEAPALAAMIATPHPTAFPIQARAIAVPMPGHAGLTAIIVGVSASTLTFAEDAKTGTYAGDTVVLASLAHPDGSAARKVSQEYKLGGKLEQLPQAKAGSLLFFRSPDLAPGTYSMDAVVYDAKASKASVATTSVTVPDSGALIMGDLFIVSRAERLPANDPGMANHPLATAGVLLYPAFGEPISKAKQAELTFAVSLVVAPGTAAPTAALQLLQNGQKLAEIPLPLDKPAADGRLLQVSRLPTAAIPAGTYDMKVVVTAGAARAERGTTVTLVN